jgi:hypothetical protein
VCFAPISLLQEASRKPNQPSWQRLESLLAHCTPRGFLWEAELTERGTPLQQLSKEPFKWRNSHQERHKPQVST